MTGDELDLLASSYLDGEATPDEVALVEGDPGIMARVEQFRSLRVPTPTPPAGLAQAQMAQAMALYRPGTQPNFLAGDTDSDPTLANQSRAEGTQSGPETTQAKPDPTLVTRSLADETELNPNEPSHDHGGQSVVDLAARRERRERQSGRLRWLTSAAAVAVVGFGAVTVVSQMGGGGDETAQVMLETNDMDASQAADGADSLADDAGMEAATESAVDESATDATQAAATEDSDMADTASAESAASDESMDGDSSITQSSGADRSTGDDAEQSLASGGLDNDSDQRQSIERLLRDLPQDGFFPDEPAVTYNLLPTGDELVGDLEVPWRDEGTSKCLSGFPPDGSTYSAGEDEVIAYLPFEVTDGDDTGDYEALYVVVNGATESVLILPSDTCQLG